MKVGLLFKILIKGEKDPRNILVMFNLVSKLPANIPISYIEPYINNIFDIIQEYYPVDFEPPSSGSPDTITCEDLSNALNQCFSSTDLYMQRVIELIKGISVSYSNCLILH